MSGDAEGRRFSDEEFALILRKAAELQHRRPRADQPGAGFSLAEIEEIAAEAGIDPGRVREAASLVSARTAPAESWARVLGGPLSFRLESEVGGEVAEEDLGKLVDTIRRVADAQGKAERVLDSLEWSDEDDLGPVHVNVTPRDGRTTIQVLASRGQEAGLAWFVGGFGGLVTGLVTAGALDLGPGLVALTTVLSTTGVGLAGARSFWHYQSRRWQEKTARLLERLTERARELTEPEEG